MSLIKNIWKQYHTDPIPVDAEMQIIEKAQSVHKKTKGKFKFSTILSWFARQFAHRHKK